MPIEKNFSILYLQDDLKHGCLTRFARQLLHRQLFHVKNQCFMSHKFPFLMAHFSNPTKTHFRQVKDVFLVFASGH